MLNSSITIRNFFIAVQHHEVFMETPRRAVVRFPTSAWLTRLTCAVDGIAHAATAATAQCSGSSASWEDAAVLPWLWLVLASRSPPRISSVRSAQWLVSRERGLCVATICWLSETGTDWQPRPVPQKASQQPCPRRDGVG